jgi:hypothetical protein
MISFLTRLATTCLAAGLLAVPVATLAQVSVGARGVPTYESIGLYWPHPGIGVGATGCEVRFRRSADAAWRQGLNLWYDARNDECRGSLVQLDPDTEYQVQLSLPGSALVQTLSVRTWPNQWPVATRIPVASGPATLVIAAGGTPAGYVVYEGLPGAVLDAQNLLPFNVSINASYVIVRNHTLRGAQRDAIRIAPNVTDVIIEDNEISGWGRQRTGGFGVEQDSAIHAECATPTLARVTIQRNQIHDPRYSANSWSDGHPEGPQAVSLFNCGGNHVIRHNDIYGSPGHYYNDIIGGGANDFGGGFPNADSDIYGNRLSHAWDDAIEAEGANTNVRIWGNYMDQTGTGIATTPTTSGPVYLFRNVYNRSRLLEDVPPDQDDRQVMFKAGSDPTRGNGRRYIFHNTMLQARQSGSAFGLGASGGISGTSASTPVNNTVSRNNIFENWRTWTAYFDVGSGNDFGWDLFNGAAGAPVTNPIMATPVYAPGNGWQSESGGAYQLAPGTPGHDQGVRIPNFNDAYTGAAPDVGAHEGGTAPMRFGSVATTTPPPAPPNPPRLGNISTRGQVLTGNDVMIGGFVIGGSASKRVAIVGTGPSLTAFGIANALPNPTLRLVASATGETIAANDDWPTAPNAAEIATSGFAPSNPLESAILMNLAPGAYTAILSGVGGSTGVGVVAVYEVDRPDAPLTNISTRGQVLTGNEVMIGGFVIQGSIPQQVAVVATGPSLAAYGIANALQNPTLSVVRSSDQAVIASNDNWQSDPNAGQLQSKGFAPAHALEAGVLLTLAPGAYTVVVQGVGGGTGVGVFAVYAVP